MKELVKKAEDLGHRMGAVIKFYDEYQASCCQDCPKLIHIDSHGKIKTSAKSNALNHACK